MMYESSHDSCVSTSRPPYHSLFFFFNDTATTEIYTLSLHDALPICGSGPNTYARIKGLPGGVWQPGLNSANSGDGTDAPELESRSEEHTSELQSLRHLVCRLLLEKKKETNQGAVRGCRTQASPHGHH